MTRLAAVLLIASGLLYAGCNGDGSQYTDLARAKLVEKGLSGNTMVIRFAITGLDKALPPGKSIRIQLFKGDTRYDPKAPSFEKPGRELQIEVTLDKRGRDADRIGFNCEWGTPEKGMLIECEDAPLNAEGQLEDDVVLPAFAGRRLTQLLHTFTGPGKSVSFTPSEGLNLLTVGFKKDVYHLRIWSE